MTQKIKTREEEAVLKEEDKNTISEILNSEKVKNSIGKKMLESEEKGQEVKKFISNNLGLLFKKGEATSREIEAIFNAVVKEDEVKKELELIFESFSDNHSSEVNKALRNLDDELRQVSKPLQVMQNTLEGTSGFFSNIVKSFTGKTDAIVLSNTIKGIRGRIENISITLAKGKKELERNQKLLEILTPKIGLRIAKLKGMSSALDYVINNNKDFDKGTLKLLTGLKQEIDNLTATQVADLQKLSVLAQINVNNKILLTTTEKKIITKITSAILVNSVAGSEKTVKDMAKSVNNTLASLDAENSKNVKELMIEEEKEALRTKVEMTNTVKSIEDFSKEISAHNDRMDKIYVEIKKFLPEFKERLEKAEEGIYKNFKTANNDEANVLLRQLKEETEELQSKYNDDVKK